MGPPTETAAARDTLKKGESLRKRSVTRASRAVRCQTGRRTQTANAAGAVTSG